MKIGAIPEHPTQSIINGTQLLKTAKDDTDPIRVKARQIHNEIASPTIQPLVCSASPPWQLRPSVTDTTLMEKIRGTDDLFRRKSVVEDHIRSYEGRVAVYADKRNTAGKVSCSFYVPFYGHHESYRMTDGSSVLAAEMGP